MTFYDDAEFAAISLTRLAAAEHDGDDGSRAVEMARIADDLLARHGPGGLAALVVALSRHHSATLAVLAQHQGLSLDELLDRFEAHKLDQIHGTPEEP